MNILKLLLGFMVMFVSSIYSMEGDTIVGKITDLALNKVTFQANLTSKNVEKRNEAWAQLLGTAIAFQQLMVLARTNQIQEVEPFLVAKEDGSQRALFGFMESYIREEGNQLESVLGQKAKRNVIKGYTKFYKDRPQVLLSADGLNGNIPTIIDKRTESNALLYFQDELNGLKTEMNARISATPSYCAFLLGQSLGGAFIHAFCNKTNDFLDEQRCYGLITFSKDESGRLLKHALMYINEHAHTFESMHGKNASQHVFSGLIDYLSKEPFLLCIEDFPKTGIKDPFFTQKLTSLKTRMDQKVKKNKSL